MDDKLGSAEDYDSHTTEGGWIVVVQAYPPYESTKLDAMERQCSVSQQYNGNGQAR